MCLDTGLNLVDMKRLGHVIHATGLKGLYLVDDVAKCAEKYHWDSGKLLVRFQLPANLVTVHLWHRDIQQNQIRWVLDSCRQCLPSPLKRPRSIALLPQHVSKQLHIGWLIIHYHDVPFVLLRGNHHGSIWSRFFGRRALTWD